MSKPKWTRPGRTKTMSREIRNSDEINRKHGTVSKEQQNIDMWHRQYTPQHNTTQNKTAWHERRTVNITLNRKKQTKTTPGDPARSE